MASRGADEWVGRCTFRAFPRLEMLRFLKEVGRSSEGRVLYTLDDRHLGVKLWPSKSPSSNGFAEQVKYQHGKHRG